MSAQDYEQLTLFREDSPVSRSLSPGSSEARKMTVTSGLRCLELSGSFGPLGSLARMCLGSSIWHSTRCWLTWKTRATPSKRTLYRLAASTPRTDGNDALFWPTPSTGAALCGGTGNWKTLKAMERRGLITEAERKELSKGNGGKTNPALLEWLMGYEQAFTRLIPTPRASDYKGAASNRWYSQTVHVERERERERQGGRYRSQLCELAEATPLGIIGRLNPMWIEWLMGYPTGWTELER